MAYSGKIAFAAGVLLILGALPAQSAPLAVNWPQGWTVHQAPPAQNAPAGARPDTTQTAMKMGPNGAPLAAISLMTMDIQPGDTVQLSEQAQSMLGTIQNGYTSQGFKVSCEPLAKTTLGSLPALQSACQAGKETPTAPAVKQIVVLTVGAHEIYGVTYAAAPQNFATYQPEFKKLEAGLKLQ